MLDKQKSELQRVLQQMSLSDLTLAKQMLARELDQRHGRAPKPIKWDAPLSTR